ncbi:MAG: nucleotidyltransferase [Deltaproteobacteria bacterium]|nr:nucleotidyltransferase [Deltaproteobacteria bacterium]
MEPEKQYEKDFKEFIEILNKHGVEYMIVGAYAVMFHTHISRDTKDIAFWINRTEENVKKCIEAIEEFSGERVNADSLLIKDSLVFIGQEPYRIDILNEQGDLHFNKAYSNKTEGIFFETKTTYISKIDLLALKEYYHRDQDIKDIKRLKKTEEVQDIKPRGRHR